MNVYDFYYQHFGQYVEPKNLIVEDDVCSILQQGSAGVIKASKMRKFDRRIYSIFSAIFFNGDTSKPGKMCPNSCSYRALITEDGATFYCKPGSSFVHDTKNKITLKPNTNDVVLGDLLDIIAKKTSPYLFVILSTSNDDRIPLWRLSTADSLEVCGGPTLRIDTETIMRIRGGFPNKSDFIKFIEFIKNGANTAKQKEEFAVLCDTYGTYTNDIKQMLHLFDVNYSVAKSIINHGKK